MAATRRLSAILAADVKRLRGQQIVHRFSTETRGQGRHLV